MYLLSEFLPEICWEEIAEEILFVFRFDVWSGTRTMAFRLKSQNTLPTRPRRLSFCLRNGNYFWCFPFYQKMCTLFKKKNAILCLFLKNVSPSKRVVCFILNNLHFPMVKGIAFYALYKSRVLIIPCKVDEFCLVIGLPDEI